jgi:hypothetical protein
MRIRDVRKESIGDRVRVSARVEWEDVPRPPVDLFFETEAAFDHDLADDANAFLVACILPAMRHGEERIALDGPVCPRLCEGLSTAVKLLRSWFGPPRREVRIEPARGFRSPLPVCPARSALFFTGGVDSLHLLMRNRIDYPHDHSESFQDALAVFGFFSPERLDPGSPLAGFTAAHAVFSEVAEDAGIRLIPIVTNVTLLDPDLDFLAEEFLSAALCSTAHLFSGSLSSISLASGRNVRLLIPRGTHPLLDPCFSTGALDVRHIGIGFSRLDRLREICQWDVAIRNLFVCLQAPPPPRLNCGECEKCVRTMTALAALGRLADARQFPESQVSPEMIESADITPHVAPYWRDLLGPLRDAGRSDLADEVELKLAHAERTQMWFADAGWKGRIRRLDRRILGGAALELRRRLQSFTTT